MLFISFLLVILFIQQEIVSAYNKALFHHVISKRDSTTSRNDPIVILHGLLGSSRNFQSWASLLHDKLDGAHDVICCDLRNHGRSTTLGSLDMDYASMASDVVATMDVLGVKKAHLVGHSMGGKVAAAASLMYGGRGSDRRDCFPSVTMMDISPIAYSADEFSDVTSTVKILKVIDEDFNRLACKDTLEQQIVEAFPDVSLRQFVQSNMQIQKDGRLRWNFHLDEIHDSLDEIAANPYDSGSDDVTPFPHPVLVLKGSTSNFVRSSHVPQLAALFPKYNLGSVKDAGHWLHFDKPEETTDKVAHFINAVKAYHNEQQQLEPVQRPQQRNTTVSSTTLTVV